jgi:hypothetical protein
MRTTSGDGPEVDSPDMCPKFDTDIDDIEVIYIRMEVGNISGLSTSGPSPDVVLVGNKLRSVPTNPLAPGTMAEG